MTLGSDCVGCGYCCRKVPCAYSVMTYGDIEKCRSLVFKGGRFWCGEVINSTDEERVRIQNILHIGAGCCSSLNSDRREKIQSVQKTNR
jgi:hypothetical protein